MYHSYISTTIGPSSEIISSRLSLLNYNTHHSHTILHNIDACIFLFDFYFWFYLFVFLYFIYAFHIYNFIKLLLFFHSLMFIGGTILGGIIIILLLYVDDIVLMARCSSDLDKQSWIVKYFCSKFITSSIGTIALRKGLMEGGKPTLVLKIIVNHVMWDKKKLLV